MASGGSVRDSMKTLDRMKKHEGVTDAWHESENGYWVLAGTGWRFDHYGDNIHAIHEGTLKELRRQFKTLRRCKCIDCEARALFSLTTSEDAMGGSR